MHDVDLTPRWHGKGTKGGRISPLQPDSDEWILQQLKKGIPQQIIAELMGVSRSSLTRRLRKIRNG